MAAARKIVIVEDEADVRELETFLLESEGFSVVGVPDGRDVVQRVKDERPDLLLLDFLLPGKTANDILAELKSDPATAHVPVIVVSGYADRLHPSDQVRRVLPKPFDVRELLDAVTHDLADDRPTGVPAG